MALVVLVTGLVDVSSAVTVDPLCCSPFGGLAGGAGARARFVAWTGRRHVLIRRPYPGSHSVFGSTNFRPSSACWSSIVCWCSGSCRSPRSVESYAISARIAMTRLQRRQSAFQRWRNPSADSASRPGHRHCCCPRQTPQPRPARRRSGNLRRPRRGKSACKTNGKSFSDGAKPTTESPFGQSMPT